MTNVPLTLSQKKLAKNFNRYVREALLLIHDYLISKDIKVKKQYPKITAFCKLQNLIPPIKINCEQWLVELYLSNRNKICCKDNARVKIRAGESKNYFQFETDIGNSLEAQMESNPNVYVSFHDAYIYLSKYRGYGHSEFNDLIKYVKLSDIKHFTDTHVPDHSVYLRSAKWRAIKEYIREKYNYTCQKCNQLFVNDVGKLHTHHVTYDNLGDEDVDKDLILLCEDCHRKEHKK